MATNTEWSLMKADLITRPVFWYTEGLRVVAGAPYHALTSKGARVLNFLNNRK